MLLTANPAISTLEAVVTGAGQVLLAFSVVFALLNCFFGYKLIKVWAAIAGFLLGWVIGFFAALYFLENVGACALIGVVVGVLCGLAAFFVYRVGVFLFCFFQGLSLCLALIPNWPGVVVGLIVGGMVICEIFSSCTLVVLHRRRRGSGPLPGPGEAGRLRRRRVLAVALPMGLNALLGNLLGAANAALIPQELVAGGADRSDAIAQFGVVCGMTMPMLSLPIVFLGAINLVLMPRLARATALGRTGEIRRLISQAVRLVSVLTLPAMALMVVLGPDLGRAMFHQEGVGDYLLPLAAATAMGCYGSVLAACLNGVGSQRAVAAISLLGGGVQLLFPLALVPLPGVGMGGYVAGAVVSTALELALCLCRACHRTGLRPQLFQWAVAPGLAALLAGLTGNLLFRFLRDSGLALPPAGLASLLFLLLLYLAALQAQGVRLAEVLRLDW